MCLESFGGKWKGVVLFHLLGGTKRFNELMRLMPGVSQRMLTKQLRELEAQEIIHRKIYPEVPPKVEYRLTEFGETLAPVLAVVHLWGERYLEHIAALPVRGHLSSIRGADEACVEMG